MRPVDIDIADGVELVAAPRGVRLRGPAHAVVATVQQLRVLRDAAEGTSAQLGEWTLLVGGLFAAAAAIRLWL